MDDAKSIWDALGGRKFIGFVVVVSLGTVIAVMGHLNEWTTGLLLGAYTIYCAGNVANTRKALDGVKQTVQDIKDSVGP